MSLTRTQIAAIVKAGKTMIAADGRILDEELAVLGSEIENRGLSPTDIPDLLAEADAMGTTGMIKAISSLSYDEKCRVAGFLAAIMVIDGDIDPEEVKLWKLTCTLVGCPEMTIQEAISCWR